MTRRHYDATYIAAQYLVRGLGFAGALNRTMDSPQRMGASRAEAHGALRVRCQ
jgi:hypothetical protein